MSTEPQSLPERFRASVRRHAARVAVAEEGRRLTYAELDGASDRVAGHLAAGGVRAGDRVGLYCLNGGDFATAYFGILKAGSVVVPINLLLNPKEVAFLLRDAGVRVLLMHEAFAAALPVLRAEAPEVRTIVRIGADATSPGEEAWAAWVGEPAEPPALSLDARRDLAAILYTSGTTGYPKGAMLTHYNLTVNADSIREALRLEEGREVFLVVLPMFHAFAATVGLITPLLNGCALVPLPRFDPEAVARAIEREQITVLPAVPSMYSVLLRLPEDATARFRSLRRCFSGGAAMPLEVMRQFEARFGVPVCEGDGPTECAPVTCVNPVDGPRKPGSVGLPVAQVEMKIMDEQGGELPHGQIGEICVRGPNVMKGYWNRPEDTAAAFFGAWFRTGDLGTEDDDGYFYIVDRKKDMLIANGMNVYPRIIEEVLYRHPAVREAAVVGEPHPLHGEIPVAYISLKPGAAADAQALRAFCRESLGRHEIPRKVVFMDELPKNAAGKIVKRQLRRNGELERGVDLPSAHDS